MIHSINRWHLLGRSRRIFLLAAAGFGIATSPMAQEGKQTPAGVEGDVSGWVKLCAKDEHFGNAGVCLVKYEELESQTGSVLLTAAVRTVEDGHQLIVNVPVAYTLVISAGLQAKIDDGEPVSMQFSVCLPTSCQAQVALNKEMLQRMMAGKQLVIAAVNMQKKTLGFPVPLLGFRKAWEGAPVDTMKYQAARRQMLDFARKTAEKQRDARQSGTQLPADGTVPESPKPNGSTTVPKRILTPAAP